MFALFPNLLDQLKTIHIGHIQIGDQHIDRVALRVRKLEACLAVLEVDTKEKSSVDLLFTNRFGIFLRGEGGFGSTGGH